MAKKKSIIKKVELDKDLDEEIDLEISDKFYELLKRGDRQCEYLFNNYDYIYFNYKYLYYSVYYKFDLLSSNILIRYRNEPNILLFSLNFNFSLLDNILEMEQFMETMSEIEDITFFEGWKQKFFEKIIQQSNVKFNNKFVEKIFNLYSPVDSTFINGLLNKNNKNYEQYLYKSIKLLEENELDKYWIISFIDYFAVEKMVQNKIIYTFNGITKYIKLFSPLKLFVDFSFLDMKKYENQDTDLICEGIPDEDMIIFYNCKFLSKSINKYIIKSLHIYTEEKILTFPIQQLINENPMLYFDVIVSKKYVNLIKQFFRNPYWYSGLTAIQLFEIILYKNDDYLISECIEFIPIQLITDEFLNKYILFAETKKYFKLFIKITKIITDIKRYITFDRDCSKFSKDLKVMKKCEDDEKLISKVFQLIDKFCDSEERVISFMDNYCYFLTKEELEKLYEICIDNGYTKLFNKLLDEKLSIFSQKLANNQEIDMRRFYPIIEKFFKKCKELDYDLNHYRYKRLFEPFGLI